MKFRPLQILLFAIAALSARGEIVIDGVVKLPPAKASPAASGRYQQKAGAVAKPESPSAVVYLEGDFPKDATNPGRPAVIEQKNFQFLPGVLPVQKGAKVEFPNLDDDYHHVFSYSRVKEFDLGRYRKDEKAPGVLFDKVGTVKVGCEIHDHMRAVVLVLDTPYFTKTDAEGKYRLTLPDLPAGHYTLKAWINEKTVWEQSIELKAGATANANFPHS